ncbi:MAG: hypothetical protein JWN41_458 [Thermoleophilia bacterium]|nr:hypothetical protein [Thermoleophilia bacterium]
MSRIWSFLRRTPVLVLAAAIVLAGVTSIAVAASRDSGGKRGCYNATSGALRVLVKGTACKKNERALQLGASQVSTLGAAGAAGPKGDTGASGPQGDTGATGPQGVPGAKGDAGAKGDKGDTGAKGDKGDSAVPAPKYQKVQGTVTGLTANPLNVLGFSYEATAAMALGGTGGSIGRAHLGDVTLITPITSDTPNMLVNVASGRRIASVTLALGNTAKGGVHHTYTFSNVTMTKIEPNVTQADGRHVQTLSFAFAGTVTSSGYTVAPKTTVPFGANAAIGLTAIGTMRAVSSRGTWTVPIYEETFSGTNVVPLATGGGVGRFSPSDIEVEHLLDAHTPELHQSIYEGVRYTEITITLNDVGGTAPVYTFKNAYLTQVADRATGESDTAPVMEHLAFTFSYVGFSVNGVHAAWDAALGRTA